MATKTESTLKNMVLVLFLVSAISAAALAFVYKITKDPIEKAKTENQKKAVGEVVPKFDNDPISEEFKIALAPGDTLSCFPAKLKGQIVAYAIKSYTKKGFGGDLIIMTGFKTDGSIYSTSVLEQKETPGLGDKIQKSKSDWSEQFIGIIPQLNPDNSPKNVKVKKDGGNIDAITASTITSRAFCDAVNRATIAFNKIKK